jgi:hypothetical protein
MDQIDLRAKHAQDFVNRNSRHKSRDCDLDHRGETRTNERVTMRFSINCIFITVLSSIEPIRTKSTTPASQATFVDPRYPCSSPTMTFQPRNKRVFRPSMSESVISMTSSEMAGQRYGVSQDLTTALPNVASKVRKSEPARGS